MNTRHIVRTIALALFGMFIGIMGFFLYSEYLAGALNFDLSVAVETVNGEVYEQKMFDKPKIVSFQSNDIQIEKGDLFINSFGFKVAANAPVNFKIDASLVEPIEGRFYLTAPYELFLKFEDVNTILTIGADTKVIVDSEAKRVIFLDQNAEQRWLVDTWATLPYANEKVSEEYKQLSILMEDLKSKL